MEAAALSSSLLPAPNASLPDTIAALLRERIIAGQFRPGVKLVEAEIARQLQTSRGPVREALAQLRAEGLVIERPRRGSFVAELSADDVREIYELRAAFEGRAARLIIEHNDKQALRELGATVDALRQAAAHDDRIAFAELDARFHDALCRLSGNARLHRAFVQQAGLLNVLLRLEITTQYETLDPLLAEHVQLFDDISSGDPGRAEAGCERHLSDALERVTGMLKASAQH